MSGTRVCSIIETDCPFDYETCRECHVYNVVEDAKRKAYELEDESRKE